MARVPADANFFLSLQSLRLYARGKSRPLKEKLPTPPPPRHPKGPFENPHYKQRFCRTFWTGEACRYGKDCQFAHSEAERVYWCSRGDVEGAVGAGGE